MRIQDILHDFGGRSAVFFMAADLEYGPALQARIRPVMTGVGPVEAGVVAADVLAQLAARGTVPDIAICLGSAGSQKLPQGAVYTLSAVMYRDMDARPLGFEMGQVPLSDLPIEMPLTVVPALPVASCGTGGSVVSAQAYASLSTDLVEMETYAVLRACQRHDVPLVGLRGISDGAEPLEGIGDWTELLPVLDTRLADALDHLEAQLRSGRLDLGA